MNKHPRIFQLLGVDGQEVGLYICFASKEEMGDYAVMKAIEDAFYEAGQIAAEGIEEGCDDIWGVAEEKLAPLKIERLFLSAECHTNVI